MAVDQCGLCGLPLDAHQRNVRFLLPEPVHASQGRETVPGAWLSHDSPAASVLMRIPAVGSFVRALLPIRLTGGYTLTYGLWAQVSPADLKRAFDVWWAPEYADLHMIGTLANAIKPWGLLGVPVSLAVRDPEQTPYCVSSPDPMLTRVLTDEWPHEQILEGLP